MRFFLSAIFSFLKTAAKRLAVVVCALIIVLLLAEGVIRLTGVDWRYVEKNLYFHQVDLASHVADPNPDLLYRLKPNTSVYYTYAKRPYRVTINAQGARGPKRSDAKPAGVYRIIVIGGSNVYGAEVNDEEAWPAYLESELNGSQPGRYEVWNMGTSAYVGLQLVQLAWEVLPRYDPDLIVLALSNMGQMPFLEGTEVAPYFAKKPTFWRYLLPPKYFNFPAWLSMRPKTWLLQHVGLFRFGILVWASMRKNSDEPLILHPLAGDLFEEASIQSMQTFLRQAKDKVKTCIFVGPYFRALPQSYEVYYQGTDTPAFILKADDLSAEYRDVHPPPHVNAWYATRIAGWLREKKLLVE